MAVVSAGLPFFAIGKRSETRAQVSTSAEQLPASFWMEVVSKNRLMPGWREISLLLCLQLASKKIIINNISSLMPMGIRTVIGGLNPGFSHLPRIRIAGFRFAAANLTIVVVF
jgi:hypothetical protein